MPDLRWVHRIEQPGCAGVGNGSSVDSKIPRRVEGEVSVSSYTDSLMGNRAEDNCAGRGAKAVNDYCLAGGAQMFVPFYITTDLSASIISNSNYRMACTRTRQQEHCRERPRKQFHASYLPQM